MTRKDSPLRARRILVVALHKSGTHLIAKLLQNLGYATLGEGLDNRPPPWAETINADFFRQFPEDTAFFFHGLALDDIPLFLAERWTHSHQPPILFHYRDPRAVLVSLVNYLLRRGTSGSFSRTGYQIILADVLRQSPPERHLELVMRCYPEYFRINFERQLWLRFHPSVCRTRFEDLVGPRGGGDRARQEATIAKVLRHLRVEGDPVQLAGDLFDSSQRTFHKGQADAWREAFRDEDLVLFNQHFGHLLDHFGYPRVDPAPAGASDERVRA